MSEPIPSGSLPLTPGPLARERDAVAADPGGVAVGQGGVAPDPGLAAPAPDRDPAAADQDPVASGRTARPRRPRGYLALWRAVPRGIGFLLLSLPLVVAGLGVTASLFSVGVGTLVLVVGFFILFAAFAVARGFGTLELTRLGWAGSGAIERPVWRPLSGGWFRRTLTPVFDPHAWAYLLHTLIIGPIAGITTWAVTLVWVVGGAGGVTYWFWGWFIPGGRHEVYLSRVVYEHVTGQHPTFPVRAGENVFYAACGILFLVTLPWVVRVLLLVHEAAARGLLGSWRSEGLRREVSDLGASRGAAVAAEDHSLRRLERDIHDGPQQRLVRLQMDIASARRSLADNPAGAGELLAEAQAQAQDALNELRALSRGFAPPLLEDRGLHVAFQALALRSPIPVAYEGEALEGWRLAPEVERNVYFVAAELLANVAKHSGASSARFVVRMSESADGAARMLHLSVGDDGHGGASFVDGHGLSGLVERLRGLRGSLTVVSPEGGPTSIDATVPVLT